MTQSLIREIKQNWKPSFTGAFTHVRLVIKEYSQLDKLVFHKQLDVTLRGLTVSGFTPERSKEIILDAMYEEDYNGAKEWLNGRTTSEIISNN